MKALTQTVEKSKACEQAREFAAVMARRRSVRDFSGEPVDRDVVRHAIEAAATSPSGVNRQPWRFFAISDPPVREMVRELACEQEKEEQSKSEQASLQRAVAPFQPDRKKPYLADAPWMIAIFEQTSVTPGPRDPFFNRESLGVATGILVTALHLAGVSSLVHVPVAEDYLSEVCGVGDAERLFLLVLAGYPSIEVRISQQGATKKSFHQIAEFFESGGETPAMTV